MGFGIGMGKRYMDWVRPYLVGGWKKEGGMLMGLCGDGMGMWELLEVEVAVLWGCCGVGYMYW